MKRDGRKVTRAALEEMRVMAFRRMSEGESPAAVAASFGLHRTWAYKVRAKACGERADMAGLHSRRATGRPRKLTVTQEQQVFVLVCGKNPRQYGFDNGLWTRQIVRELIERKFSVRLSLASVGNVLARLGLTPQKPLWQACQRDPITVARWQQETYPALVRQAKREQADIYYCKESCFRADAVQGKSWDAKGQTPVVKVPGQSQGIRAASVVNSKGGFLFAIYSGSLTGERFVELLQQMMSERNRPVRLVLDGSFVHKSLQVRDYVESLEGKLTLHFLPG